MVTENIVLLLTCSLNHYRNAHDQVDVVSNDASDVIFLFHQYDMCSCDSYINFVNKVIKIHLINNRHNT